MMYLMFVFHATIFSLSFVPFFYLIATFIKRILFILTILIPRFNQRFSLALWYWHVSCLKHQREQLCEVGVLKCEFLQNWHGIWLWTNSDFLMDKCGQIVNNHRAVLVDALDKFDLNICSSFISALASGRSKIVGFLLHMTRKRI